MQREKSYVVINADDFGQSIGINRGIIAAHEQGIVTSASLMVRFPAALDAARYGRSANELSIGIHFDFGEWCCRDDEWFEMYRVVPVDDRDAVQREAGEQLERFVRMMGREPSHIDSHQHFHRQASVQGIFEEIAARLNVPLRNASHRIRYIGDFYGQNDRGWPLPEYIEVDALLGLLRRLREEIAEIGCHPGYADDLDSMYKTERKLEVATLCDPTVRQAITELGIELCSFDRVRELLRHSSMVT